VRPAEAAALKAWAEQAGLIRDGGEFFRQWDAQGSMSGAEHAVYFDEESQRWVKTNNLYFHSHWLEYLHRMLLHNWLFPSVAYRLEGFIEFSPWPESGMPGVFQPLVSQPHVHALRGASRAEVVRELDQRAAEWVRNDNYRSFDGTLLVEDLHDENALVIDESEAGAPVIAFIDPVIFMTPDTKPARLKIRQSSVS
jgi:hypothetical protein